MSPRGHADEEKELEKTGENRNLVFENDDDDRDVNADDDYDDGGGSSEDARDNGR